MKKNNPSDGILVFDRYYGRKPVPSVLLVLRLLFCAAFSAAAMMFAFSQYELDVVSTALVVGVSAFSAAALLLAFIFLRRRFVVPIIVIGFAFVGMFFREELWTRLSYFVDEFMLLAEGRFLQPRAVLFHDEALLNSTEPLYESGMLMGAALLCFLYGLLCAVSMTKRIRVIPSTLGAIVLCVPCFLAESFEFDVLVVPLLLLVAAGAAIAVNYRSGLAVVRSGGAMYRQQVRREDSRFAQNTKKAGCLRRVSMQVCHYSKYTSSGIYSAVIFALALCIGISSFSQGTAIDFTEVYDHVKGLFTDDAEITINEQEAVSDYFTSPDRKDNGLGITSPGRGNDGVINVTFSGDTPIYLRGDIGIEFTGTSWVTPIVDESDWLSFGLDEYYRPAELKILNALLRELGVEDVTIADESEITIEYLCQTDVVFLPAYTGDYTYYNNPYFDVYGDYCVRVSDAADNYVNSVQCTAILHDLGDDAEATIAVATAALDKYGLYVNDLYSVFVPDVDARENVIRDYSGYVNDTYLGVPVGLSAELTEFMESSGINSIVAQYYYTENTSLFRYQTAAAIENFLKNNYTYSLSNTNRGEGAVMRFLTETKSGHCSLYATAMTLMLREVGIPARYCTGFAIHPETVSGNTKELKERDLHAWVEVYLDDFGWVTFDPTASDVADLAESENAETQRPTQTTKRPEPEAAATAESFTEESLRYPNVTDEVVRYPDTIENGGTTEPKQIPIKAIITILAAFAAVMLVIVLIWYYNRVKSSAERALSAAHNCSEACIYSCIVDLLDLHKLSPLAGELPSDFYRRVDKQLNAELASNCDILEAAAFGHGSGSGAQLSELLGKVYAAVGKRGGIFRRYRIRKIIINALCGREK